MTRSGIPAADKVNIKAGPKIAAVTLVVAAAGTMVQARFNAELVLITGNPLEVSLINLVVAAAVASIAVLCVAKLRASWFLMVRAVRGGSLRPWQLAGGALGGTTLRFRAVWR